MQVESEPLYCKLSMLSTCRVLIETNMSDIMSKSFLKAEISTILYNSCRIINTIIAHYICIVHYKRDHRLFQHNTERLSSFQS